MISDVCFRHQQWCVCHSLAYSVLEPVLDLPLTQGHSRTVPGSELREDEGHTHTLQPLVQLLGEEDNSQLTLAVGCFCVILPLLPV